MAERHCGPWRDTWLGRVRHCNNPLLPEGDPEELEIAPRPYTREVMQRVTAEHAPEPVSKPETQRETTPALPERKTPPAIERAVITDRTNELARKLIDSVFTEGATS